MKINKGDFIKKINEGLDIDEIIDKNMNLIGTDDEVNSPENVYTDATTNSFVDAARQQVGKNRLYTTFLEEEELTETNSDIEGKKYHVPHNVIQDLKQMTSGDEGSKRAQGIISSPTMDYTQIKRFKHDIENTYSGDWASALTWINSVLSTDRNMVDNQKRTTMDIGMENRFRDTHYKDSPLTDLATMHESVKTNKIILTESQYNFLLESEDFNKYKVSALRSMIKGKKEEINKLREEVKAIDAILNSKIKNNIDEIKK